MKKSNYLNIGLIIIFLLISVLFVYSFNEKSKNSSTYDEYKELYYNEDLSFKNKYRCFIPYNGMESEINEMALNSNDIILPSEIYKTNNKMEIYKADENYFKNYNFKYESITSFNFKVDKIEDVTVLLGNNYKSVLEGKEKINIKIINKTTLEIIEINALISGFFEKHQYDPINLDLTDDSIYISNINNLFTDEISYKNSVNLYTYVGDDYEDFKSKINNKARIMNFDYFNNVDSYYNNTRYLNSFFWAIIIFCVVSYFGIFGVMLYVGLKKEYQKYKKSRIITLILMAIIYFVINIFLGFISNYLFLFIPYILLMILGIINVKRVIKSDKN